MDLINTVIVLFDELDVQCKEESKISTLKRSKYKKQLRRNIDKRKRNIKRWLGSHHRARFESKRLESQMKAQSLWDNDWNIYV